MLSNATSWRCTERNYTVGDSSSSTRLCSHRLSLCNVACTPRPVPHALPVGQHDTQLNLSLDTQWLILSGPSRVRRLQAPRAAADVTSPEPHALAAALGVTDEEAHTMLAICPRLLRKSPSSLAAKAQYLVAQTGASPATITAILRQQPQLLLKSPSNLITRLAILDTLLGLGSTRAAAEAMAADAQLLSLDLEAMKAVRPQVLQELRGMYTQQAQEQQEQQQ